ncbi:fasciclin domain-containing protein [Falsiroseomonas sp.]|uniref:fasciclin domain-containing protein n=1 Tax=Falsiroseomonas sp. TaxID=2870721 RepID=UPI00356445CA
MTPMLRRGFLALGGVAAGTLAMPGLPRAQATRTLADTMAGDTRFSRFLDIITRAGAVETFRQAAPMTVFAPVDQAFSGAPAGLLQDLLGQSQGSPQNTNEVERRRVMALINYHIVPGAIGPDQMGSGERRLTTVNGSDILVSGSGASMTLRNPAPAQQLGSFGAAGANVSAAPAQVVGGPIQASNGVIYPISQVLFP